MTPAPRSLFPVPEPWRAEALALLRAEGKARSAALAACQEEARRLMEAGDQDGARVVLDLGRQIGEEVTAAALGMVWVMGCRRGMTGGWC